MIQSIKQKFTRFLRKEDGTIAVPFALAFPFFVGFMLAGVEIGISTLRHVALERSMDEAVREIRLHTGAKPSHTDIKEMICSRPIVDDCTNNVQLEMVTRDLRNWEELPSNFSCIDSGFIVNDMSELSFGEDNEMVVLRACARYKPIFKGFFMLTPLLLDENGDAYLKYTTAFVQEPR